MPNLLYGASYQICSNFPQQETTFNETIKNSDTDIC